MLEKRRRSAHDRRVVDGEFDSDILIGVCNGHEDVTDVHLHTEFLTAFAHKRLFAGLPRLAFTADKFI